VADVATTIVVVVAVAHAERISNSFYIYFKGQDETPALFFGYLGGLC
jgi:hypothetical protein